MLDGSRSVYDDGASRSGLIIGLIALSLLLVLGLAWQAQRAASTHLETGTRVLRDYARLVADEYVRRASAEVGYRGYYTLVTSLRQHAASEEKLPASSNTAYADGQDARALAAYLINYDGAADQLQTDGAVAPSDQIKARIRTVAARIANDASREAPFAVDHGVLDGASHSFILARSGHEGRVVGFEVDRAELGRRLQRAFETDSLLPQSLAGGTITNDDIYLRIQDGSGDTLFESGGGYDPYLRISRTLDEQYNGIFRGYELAAAIDPAIAGSLVIGGLPRSRLPLVLLLLLLTVGVLVAAIRQLQRERAVMRMRANFVSEVSHELRTPLTQIRMFAETLLYNRVRNDEERVHALEIINREAQRLMHLVENVLRFSSGRRAKHELRMEPLLLAPVVAQVIEEFRPLTTHKRMRIECDLDGEACAAADPDALRQMLLNLLDNAVKYGETGQTIRIGLRQYPGIVRLTVADQGPGVPPAQRERIWSGYYRLERERESAIAGTGIGLAVVRELVDRHDGEARVEASSEGGARFVIELPVVVQERPEAVPPEARGGSLASGAR